MQQEIEKLSNGYLVNNFENEIIKIDENIFRFRLGISSETVALRGKIESLLINE